MFHWTIHLEGEHRENHAAVVVGHEIYCFGGATNQIIDPIEVFVFNTLSLRWRKLTPAVSPGTGGRHLEVPSRHWGHTAVLIGDAVYLWGGWTGEGLSNVLYAFDVNAHIWFKPRVSGTVPEERDYHSACVLGKVMFIHGGCMQTALSDADCTNDSYKLDTSTMVWTLINTRETYLPATFGHSATIIGTKMFVYGGLASQYCNTIRVFDTETNFWMNTPSLQLLPQGRSMNHSAFTYNGELYIFGALISDVWKFSPETFSLKKVEPKGKRPSKMYRISMCCCIVGDRVILFGAEDLYVLDFSPSLKTLCKPAVIQYGLDQSELPHDIRWELAAMTSLKQIKQRGNRDLIDL